MVTRKFQAAILALFILASVPLQAANDDNNNNNNQNLMLELIGGAVVFATAALLLYVQKYLPLQQSTPSDSQKAAEQEQRDLNLAKSRSLQDQQAKQTEAKNVQAAILACCKENKQKQAPSAPDLSLLINQEKHDRALPSAPDLCIQAPGGPCVRG